MRTKNSFLLVLIHETVNFFVRMLEPSWQPPWLLKRLKRTREQLDSPVVEERPYIHYTKLSHEKLNPHS